LTLAAILGSTPKKLLTGYQKTASNEAGVIAWWPPAYGNNLLMFMLKCSIFQYTNGGILAFFDQYRFLVFL